MFKNLFKKAFGIIRIVFLSFTYQITIFSIGLLIIRMLQVSYRISDLNYFIIMGLLLSGMAIYYICGRLLNSKVYRIAAAIIILASILMLSTAYTKKIVQFLVYLYTLLKQISEAIYTAKDTFGYQYLPFMIVFLPAGTAAFMYLYEHGKGYMSAIAAIAFLLLLWYTGFDYDIRNYCYPYLFLVAVIFTISTFKASIYDFSIKRYKITVSRKKITSYMVFCCLLIALCGIIFKEALGVRSIPEIVEEAAAKYREEKIETGESYDLTKSGYSQNVKSLGGPLVFNMDIAMRVKTNSQLYLRGTVKDNYDGSVWTKSPSVYVQSDGNSLISIDSHYNAYLNSSRSSEESPVKEKAIIYPENINVSTFFTPLYTFNILPAEGSFQYDDSYNFLNQRGQVVKKSYIIEYFESSGKVLRPGNIHSQENLILYSSGKDMDDIKKEYYSEHVEKAYEKFLQLPSSITDDIVKLVNTITSGCKDNSEKLIKIQEYLIRNYVYSTEVPRVPDGRDFLDYFLFSEKKGYCTYFATASTIFCRIAGIPARYVEGFRMGTERDQEGLYIVGNEMAHAWTEVLASPENDIWITLDCTPLITQPVTTKDRQMAVQGRRWGIGIRRYNTGDNSDRKFILPVIRESFWLWIIAVFSLLIISYTAYSVISYHSRVRFICNSSSMAPIYGHVKKRLQSAGLNQFSSIDDERWVDSFSDDTLKAWLRTMVNSAYAEFYGRRIIRDFDKKGLYDYIEEYMKSKQNILRYIFKKYFI